jgi:uncharacterized membrane-anchored protein YhcB (DUF1043 family)
MTACGGYWFEIIMGLVLTTIGIIIGYNLERLNKKEAKQNDKTN